MIRLLSKSQSKRSPARNLIEPLESLLLLKSVTGASFDYLTHKHRLILWILSLPVLLGAGGQPPATGLGQDPEHQIQASIITFCCAIAADDARLIGALLYADNDSGNKLAAAHARRIIASHRLQIAIDAKLPHRDCGIAQKLFRIDVDCWGLLIAHDWKIVGDRATCRVEDLENDGEQIPSMRNVGGVWKLDVTPSPLPTVESVAALADAVELSARIMEQVTSDLIDGKLRTIQQVQAAARDIPQFVETNFTPDIVLALPAQPPK